MRKQVYPTFRLSVDAVRIVDGLADPVEAGRELGVTVPYGRARSASTMARLRACRTTQAPTGLAVTPLT